MRRWYLFAVLLTCAGCSNCNEGKDQKKDQVAVKKEGPRHRGNLGQVSDRLIKGWAFDSTTPNKPVEVEIYEGSNLLAKTKADLSRKHLSKMLPDNHHGFSVATPDSLKDGKEHTIRAM